MEQIKEKKQINVTGATLKWVAAITMLIDHLAATGVFRLVVQAYQKGGIKYQMLYALLMMMRGIGRLSMPLFCFLLVEGILHTSNPKKYGMRLFLFAIISDVPFCLALNQELPSLTSEHNVMFTLFLGFLAIEGSMYAKEKIKNVSFYKMTCVGISVLAMAIAWWIRCDYDIIGVCVILLLYWSRMIWPQKTEEFQFFISELPLIAMSMGEIPCLLDVFFIKNYNGERGKQMKYFFYLFYPAHLAILALLFH